MSSSHKIIKDQLNLFKKKQRSLVVLLESMELSTVQISKELTPSEAKKMRVLYRQL